jgi:hypothetical protein
MPLKIRIWELIGNPRYEEVNVNDIEIPSVE